MADIIETQDDGAPMRWLSISAAIASISVVGIAIGLGMPLLSVILESRGYSATMIGLNTAVAGLASIAAAPLATPLAMRFGVVWTMLAMILLGAFAFLGFYFATAFWIWFPLRAVLHIALTVLFILSEFWISTSAPPARRGLVLGIYATVLSLGFAGGPWLFAQIGSQGFMPFGVTFGLVVVAAIPVLAAWRESPAIVAEGELKRLCPLHLAGADRNGRRSCLRGGGNRRFCAVSRLWQPHRLFGSRRSASADDDRSWQCVVADPARHGQRPDQRPAAPAAGLCR